MRQHEYRAWTGEMMDYDYRDVSLWNGILIAEGDMILLQWTGLQDRHGTKIYEGDVIRYLDNTGLGLVEKMTYIEDIRALPDFTCSKWEEVVGNIYEHPELLPEPDPSK
jgi:hypothetical protein